MMRPSIQTGYAALRCAIEWGQGYLPSAGLKSASLAGQILFACDLIDTAYTGWHVHQEMRKEDRSTDERYYVDLAVKAAALTASAAAVVFVANKVFIPWFDPLSLMQKTSIPADHLDPANLEKVIDVVTATWTKPLLENLTTGLFFIRTVLDVYLMNRSTYETRQSHFYNAAFHGATSFKSAFYRTLAIKMSFHNLLYRVNYSTFEGKYPEFAKYINLAVKQVDAIFHVNTAGLSEQKLVDKINAIYDYSQTMFHQSFWNRYWKMNGREIKDYYDAVLKNSYSGSFNFSPPELKYSVSLTVDPPPVPLNIRVLHEDKIQQSFGYNFFSIFSSRSPADSDGKILYTKWIPAKLDYPIISQLEGFANKISSFVKRVLQID